MEIHFTCMSVVYYLGTCLSVSRRNHSNGLRACNVSTMSVLRCTNLPEISTRSLEPTKLLTRGSCSENLSSTIQSRVIQNFWWSTTDSERRREMERKAQRSRTREFLSHSKNWLFCERMQFLLSLLYAFVVRKDNCTDDKKV